MCWDERDTPRVTLATRTRKLSRTELLGLERQITEGVGDDVMVSITLDGVPLKDYHPIR